MKEELIWLALVSVMAALAIFYFDRQVIKVEECKALGGWYFRGHCFKDGKEIL